MAISIAVLALVAVSTLSLFLGIVAVGFWRVYPEDRTLLWFSGALFANVLFSDARLLQYLALPDAIYVFAAHLLLSSGYLIAWLSYELANSFVGHRPRLAERSFVIGTAALITALLWSTEWIATNRILLRSMPLAGDFHGVELGPLFLPASLALVVLSGIALYRLIWTPTSHKRDDLLMAACYSCVALFSAADYVAAARNLAWLRLSDYSYIPIALYFAYLQLRRLRAVFRDQGSIVRARTAELSRANQVLSSEIAERRQAQQALQVSEELYRMLFAANPQPSWVYDLETFAFLLVNDAAIEHYGYTRDEFLAMHITDIRPSSEVPALLKAVSGDTQIVHWSGPWTHCKKDGTRINVEVLSHTLEFNGRPARLAMINDITDRLRAEVALQENEEKYRTVVERANDGIAIIQDGRVKYLNRRLAEMAGQGVADVIDLHFDQFIHPSERAKVVERYSQRVAGSDEPSTYETVLQTKQGAPVMAEVAVASITYQGKPAEMVMVRDISEHKLAEQALQRQLREMTVLNAVASAGSQAVHVDELIERVTDVVSKLLYPDHCGILLADEKSRTWKPHVSYRGPGPGALKHVHSWSEGIIGQAITTGRTIRLGDVRQASAYLPSAVGIQSELAVPIVVSGKVFGCLNAESHLLDAFTDHDERLMSTIVGSLATAIEKIRLLQAEQRRREEAEILYNTTRDLVVERDLSDLLQLVAQRAASIVSATGAELFLCEPELQQVRCAVSYNAQRDYTGVTLKYGEGAAGIIAATGQPLMIPDYRTWEHRAAVYEPDRPFISILAVPMHWQGRIIGVLDVLDNSRVRSFTEEELRMVTLFANQAAMAVENARLFRQTSQRAQEAAVLAEVGRDISRALQLDATLERIAANTKDLLRARTCAVYLPDPGAQTLTAVAALGPSADEIKRDSLTLGQGILGSIALRRAGEIVNNVDQDPRAVDVPGTENLPIEHLMGVPVFNKDELTGLLAVWRVNAGQEFTGDEFAFLNRLAGQVAVAVENARLFDNLQQSNLELSQAYDTTLEGWARALELRDKETSGHSRRVTDLTLRLARRMGVSEPELVHVRRGVLLHDIGKMGIPDALLRKTGPLDRDEWAQMRKHPKYAYDLLYPIAYLRPALEIPYCHHERWDGTGYPRGLKAAEIPLAARIFMVVDVYDALLNDRPYRAAWPSDDVCEYLRRESGRLFDPQITEAFLRIVQDAQLPAPGQLAPA